jgi:hypothetical protein
MTPFKACTQRRRILDVLAGYSDDALNRQGFAVTTTLRLFLQLEFALVLFEEVAQILRPIQ